MAAIRKYPRTQHIEGSRMQPGDEDLAAMPFARLAGRHVIVEEKLDGANAALSFDERGELLLQSRGHFLTGGARERHFDLFKSWARCHQARLRAVLGSRYVVYGEWLFAKHTIFYDCLPHYFMEFDVLDRERDVFLATPERHELLRGLPLASVPVLHAGPLSVLAQLRGLLGPSRYKSKAWREQMRQAAASGESARWGSVERAVSETDRSDLAEGLYVKVEEEGQVRGRFKWVRADFLTTVIESASHWLDRPIVENGLAEGVDIFDTELA
jgi:RNA ligase